MRGKRALVVPKANCHKIGLRSTVGWLRTSALGIGEDAVDQTARPVLIGLGFIIAVCGAVVLWVERNSAAPMDFIERTFGFFARRWRRFDGSCARCSACHDHRHHGVPPAVKSNCSLAFQTSMPMSVHGTKRTCPFALQMSAYDCRFNRSTQHSLSWGEGWSV